MREVFKALQNFQSFKLERKFSSNSAMTIQQQIARSRKLQLESVRKKIASDKMGGYLTVAND